MDVHLVRKEHKVNPKDFTPEQINEMYERQSQKCVICGIRIIRIGDKIFGDPHHVKRRSSLTAMDIKRLGPGGGLTNGVIACRCCHGKIHNNEPGLERFFRKTWEEVPDEPILRDVKGL
jgi:hypothetical protein